MSRRRARVGAAILVACAAALLGGCVELPPLVEPDDARIAERYHWRPGDVPPASVRRAGGEDGVELEIDRSGDDDGWIESTSRWSPPADGWPGVAWFRFVLEVGPERERPVALRLGHRGPVEIYLDGELIERRGRPAATATDERPYLSTIRDFLVLDVGARPAVETPHRREIAVRYSAHFLESPRWVGRDPVIAAVMTAEPATLQRRNQLQHSLIAMHRWLLTGTSIAFALPFLAIVVLRRRLDVSAWFGVVCLTVAANIWFIFTEPTPDPAQALRSYSLWTISFVAMAYSIIELTYALAGRRGEQTVVRRVFAAVGVVVASVAAYQPYRGETLILLYMLAANIEIVRSMVSRRGDPVAETPAAVDDTVDGAVDGDWRSGSGQLEAVRDSWLLLVGAVPIMITGVLSVLQGLGAIPRVFDFAIFPAPYYAFLILMAAMAMALALDFVRSQNRLAQQLDRVRELSAEAIARERQTREHEVQRARLEAENARKSAELEEARQLQLSMLPETLPDIAGVELSVRTRPATEVGGDYHDAVLEPDGALLLAVGDAAGHGVQAGTVVAATKSLVQASVGGGDAPAVRLERMASALRRSGLRRRHMALILARLRSAGDGSFELELAGAAMPPVYRVRAGRVEAIELPGLPLGSFGVGPYARATIALEPGDVVVFVSDGLVEASGGQGDPVGFDRFERLVADAARRDTADAVLDHLLEAVDAFTGGAEADDDRTALALRVVDRAG